MQSSVIPLPREFVNYHPEPELVVILHVHTR